MPIFKSIITGLATQIMNQGIKKFQSQSGFTFSSPNSTFSPRPTSNGGGTIPLVTAPSNPNGRLARVALTVNDTTGMVDSVRITDSGSGYDFVPVITFNNPGGATFSNATIDSEG